MATIQKKCDTNKYSTLKQLDRDVLLLFRECKKNADSNVVEVRHFPNIVSSLLIDKLMWNYFIILSLVGDVHSTCVE